MKSGIFIWPPRVFQSKEVKEICENLTQEEELHLVRDSSIGVRTWLLIVLIIGGEISTVLISTDPIVRLWSILWPPSVVFFLLQFFMAKKYKKFLCTTEYAKKVGYTAETIKMYSQGCPVNGHPVV